METSDLWNRFRSLYFFDRATGFALDVSRINFSDSFLRSMSEKVGDAFQQMSALESGAIANPDEKRMVGHYWLRDSSKAPNGEIRAQIDSTLHSIKTFASSVHAGTIAPEKGGKFESLLLVGIGGSALGPQFVTQALGSAKDALSIYFFDNTDPDGMDKVLHEIPDLAKTLTVVVSKSGGTKETRNGQLIAKEAYRVAGLSFAKHFVAVTGDGSELDVTAKSESWLARFPMWDWVGGRTSEFSAVGLLPAALQGFNVDEILRGAKTMDELTRSTDLSRNPAALLALSWYHTGDGRGLKDMVILPYKDRLELFSRYLQQLVMESLGKEHDLDGKVVNQGIAVYGNKGSTDQHAYVQQLRDGLNNFFIIFIEVLREKSPRTVSAKLPASFSATTFEVEPGVTSGDYLSGFYQGTRTALYESNRESVSITVNEVKEFELGLLVALFERTVGLYASLVNINAYHQPGVEAGKKAAGEVLKLQEKVVAGLKAQKSALLVEELAANLKEEKRVETVFKILRHLAANGRVAVTQGNSVFEDRYQIGT